jgi:hypothetical protein
LRIAALKKLAQEFFGNRAFSEVKAKIGIVTTHWINERPSISAQAARPDFC